MHIKRSKKTALVLGAGVTALALGVGGAFAYWTAGRISGTGSAGVSSTSPLPVVVTQDTTVPVTGLSPYAGPKPIKLMIANSNSGPVSVAGTNVELSDVWYDHDNNATTEPKHPSLSWFELNAALSSAVVPAGLSYTTGTIELKNSATEDQSALMGKTLYFQFAAS